MVGYKHRQSTSRIPESVINSRRFFHSTVKEVRRLLVGQDIGVQADQGDTLRQKANNASVKKLTCKYISGCVQPPSSQVLANNSTHALHVL